MYLREVQSVALQILLKEVGTLAVRKDHVIRSVEDLLYYLELVARSLAEERVVDAPVLELQLKHV